MSRVERNLLKHRFAAERIERRSFGVEGGGVTRFRWRSPRYACIRRYLFHEVTKGQLTAFKPIICYLYTSDQQYLYPQQFHSH